jgi:hypothetical protein
MIKPPHRRRALSASLIVLGALLIFFTPNDVWIGSLLAVSGLAIELIAFGLSRDNDDKK